MGFIILLRCVVSFNNRIPFCHRLLHFLHIGKMLRFLSLLVFPQFCRSKEIPFCNKLVYPSGSFVPVQLDLDIWFKNVPLGYADSLSVMVLIGILAPRYGVCPTSDPIFFPQKPDFFISAMIAPEKLIYPVLAPARQTSVTENRINLVLRDE